MNSLEPSQTFEAARRQHLIDATIEALADVGFKAASLSQIARRADVSTGLFAHYFGDKDGLLEATLRFMAARLVRATRQRLRAAKTPRERLNAVPDSALADQEFERRTSAVWLAFWGQITHSTRYQRIQRIYQRRMLSNLRNDLRSLVPTHCVDSYATMIASMIDGVWIRSHASVTQANGAEARAIVRGLIDGLIAGAATTPVPASTTTPAALHIRIADSAVHSSAVQIVSPVTAEVLGSYVAARAKEIERVLRLASEGLLSWRGMSGADRTRALQRCADLLRTDGEDFARLDALCTGRAVAQTLEIAIPRAAAAFERVAPLASRPASERAELGLGVFGHTRHEPLGIVAGFGHWSSPLLGACGEAAPALALGNAMIFVPSDVAPLSATRLRQLVERAGLPPGVLTVLNGDAETRRLLLGRSDLASCPPTRGDPEPKSATIVFKSADLEQAALAVVHGSRRWTRTPDFSETLVFVQKSAMTAFRSRLSSLVARLRWGDPLDATTQCGALVSKVHLQHVLMLVRSAIDGGASLALGGGTAVHGSASLLEPTILVGCHNDMPIVRLKQFAPIIMILPFESDDDILRSVANQFDTGIGIFDSKIGHAHSLANRLSAKFCCINDHHLGSIGDEDWRLDSLDASPQPAIYVRAKRVFCRDDICLDVSRNS